MGVGTPHLRVRLAAALLALGLAAGCAHGLPRWAPPGSQTREALVAAPLEATFRATVGAFEKAGLKVLIASREEGRIESGRASELLYPTTGERVAASSEPYYLENAITYPEEGPTTWEVRAAVAPAEAGTRVRLSILQTREVGRGRTVIEEPDPEVFASFFSYIKQAASAAPAPGPAAPAPAAIVPSPEPPWLGLVVRQVSPELAPVLKTAQGLLVVEAVSGGPAAEAGVRPGDAVTAVAGQPVDSPAALEKALAGLKPGSEVEVRVLRGGQPHSLILKPTQPREYHYF
jgi:hypothetical protein